MKIRNSILCLFLVVTMLSGCDETADYGICIISPEGCSETNGDNYYPMHSLVKFPQALYVADQMSRKGMDFDSLVTVHRDKLMQDTWSPMLETMGEASEFSFRELLRLSLSESDNNACDLLFELFGMPEAVDAFLKELGLNHINVAVTERQMHDDISRAADNCCTPLEMGHLLLWFNEHKADNAYYQEIWEIMASCNTGEDRIPALFGDDCRIIHKTGTGFPPEEGLPQMNDAGIVLLPDGKIMAITVFVPHPTSDTALQEIVKRNLGDLFE